LRNAASNRAHRPSRRYLALMSTAHEQHYDPKSLAERWELSPSKMEQRNESSQTLRVHLLLQDRGTRRDCIFDCCEQASDLLIGIWPLDMFSLGADGPDRSDWRGLDNVTLNEEPEHTPQHAPSLLPRRFGITQLVGGRVPALQLQWSDFLDEFDLLDGGPTSQRDHQRCVMGQTTFRSGLPFGALV
jgi:hypothetical protein